MYDELLPSTEGATNNQMELVAPAVALDMLMRGRTPVTPAQFMKVVIRTDSSDVHDNVNAALYAWPKMGWKTKDGTVVLNQPDWERLVGQIERLAQRHRLRVFFEWKKGKVGRHERAVDQLAKQSSNSASFGRARPVAVRRKKTSEEVAVDSVRMERALRTSVSAIAANRLRALQGLHTGCSQVGPNGFSEQFAPQSCVAR